MIPQKGAPTLDDPGRDPVSRIENTPRGAAGGRSSTQTSRLCDEPFQVHANEMHQESTEVTKCEDQLETRKMHLLQRVIGEGIEHDGQESLYSAPGQVPGSKKEETECPMLDQSNIEPQYISTSGDTPQERRPRADSGTLGLATETSLIATKGLRAKNLIRESRAGRPAGRTIRNDKYLGHISPCHRSQSRTPKDQPECDHDGPQIQDHSLKEKPRQPSSLSRNPESPSMEDHFGEDPEVELEMLLQPQTRPISHEQLVVEIKGIYTGLALVEAKCRDVDERQLAAAQEKDPSKRIELKNDQWQSLITLHRRLIHEYHDFLLTSQHPAANPALKQLAVNYKTPARLWRYGIHAFLEVLRYRLPESSEQMATFIHIAFPMIALLCDTVSKFEDTWMECLGRILYASETRTNRLIMIQGDLGRYRAFMSPNQSDDRKVWNRVACYWYKKVANRTPMVGRLYHHLATMAHLDSLGQLSLLARSLTCVTPFERARKSITTLFSNFVHRRDTGRSSSWEIMFIRAHAILFTSQTPGPDDDFDATVDKLVRDDFLDTYIAKTTTKLKKVGAFAAISNIAALFEYGIPKQHVKARLRRAYEHAQMMKDTTSKSELPAEENASTVVPLDRKTSSVFITRPSRLTSITLALWLNRQSDKNTHPLIHIYLVFIWSLIVAQKSWKSFENDITWKIIERDIPWYDICLFLNNLAGDFHSTSVIFAEDFPRPSEDSRPLSEDFALRGQMYTQWYFPSTWFMKTSVDDDQWSLETPSMTHSRGERILWLGHRIASANRWIRWDMNAQSFVVTDHVMNEVNNVANAVSLSFDFDCVMIDANIPDERS